MTMPANISVNGMGVGTHHAKGYVHIRKGCGDYLFLHFITPYRIHLKNSVHFRDAGDCIIFSPNARQHYGSNGLIPYGNDWMHLSGPATSPLLKHLELPLNTLFSPNSSSMIHKELNAIYKEVSERRKDWELGVEARVRMFLLELSRALHGGDNVRLPPRSEEMHDRLNRLRLDMLARCAEKWDLARMLGKVHMSRSRFTNFYRSLFGASPIEDLIGMRITLAKNFLESADMNVAQIAEACGFGDSYYFCRLFKRREGMSPGAYRKSRQDGSASGKR